MSEKKASWARLKSWIDGDEVIIKAEDYISNRERKDKVNTKNTRNCCYLKSLSQTKKWWKNSCRHSCIN